VRKTGIPHGQSALTCVRSRRDPVADRSRAHMIQRVAFLQVQPWLLRVFNQQAIMHQQALRAADDPAQQPFQRGTRRHPDAVKPKLPLLVNVHAVRNRHLQVDAQVKGRARPLDQRDHPGARPLSRIGHVLLLRLGVLRFSGLSRSSAVDRPKKLRILVNILFFILAYSCASQSSCYAFSMKC
jgi:hypothetical protein